MNRSFLSFIFLCVFLFAMSISAAGTENIPSDNLVAYLPFSESFENALTNSDSLESFSVKNYGTSFGVDRFGNENSAAYFDGNESYLEISDHDAFSIITQGALTISVWVSPEVLNFENAESGGYVHWMGKGEPNQHEWTFRMYNKNLSESQENRPNRISAYAFNLAGGLGAGSYVQESLEANEWIHFVARYDVATNKITLFKNGVQKDQDDLFDVTYGVQVQNGTAPLRLGTRSKWSFFQGKIDDLRIYGRALTEQEILMLYQEENSKNENSEENSDEENNGEKPSLSISKKVFHSNILDSKHCKNPFSPCYFKAGKSFDLKGRNFD